MINSLRCAHSTSSNFDCIPSPTSKATITTNCGISSVEEAIVRIRLLSVCLMSSLLNQLLKKL